MNGIKFFIIFVVGIMSGFLNVIAGGGSFLNLAILILFGMSPALANGTNRIGILLQNAGAVWKFKKLKLLNLKYAVIASIPAVIGSLIGSYISLFIPDNTFKKIIAVLMVVVSLITIYDPQKLVKNRIYSQKRWILTIIIFFFIGIYGGFIQAGVGFFVISAVLWGGFNIIEANAIKVFVILVYTIFVLPVFILHNEMNFLIGLILGVGSVIGAQLGIGLQIKKGNRFVRIFVLAILCLFAVKLIFF